MIPTKNPHSENACPPFWRFGEGAFDEEGGSAYNYSTGIV